MIARLEPSSVFEKAPLHLRLSKSITNEKKKKKKTLKEVVLLASSANSRKTRRHRKALSERFSEASRIIGPEPPSQ